PMREPDDPVMTLDAGRSARRSGHAISILGAMRAAIFLILTTLAACRSRAAGNPASETAGDSTAGTDLTSGGSTDSILLTPRVVTRPTVLVYWLPAADTLPIPDQASA